MSCWKLFFVSGAVLLHSAIASSQELENVNPEELRQKQAEISHWVMTYYQKPHPDMVVDKVQQLSAMHLLKRNQPEANEMFLGKIMAANPDKIDGWMSAWKELPEAEQEVLRNAVWMSQTAEGKTWLKTHGFDELAEKPAHPLLTGAAMVLLPYHLDMCWEWFFATGDIAPIKQIVGKYNLLNEDPGREDLPQRNIPGADRPTMLRQSIGGAAVWSSSSLASSHNRLFEHLKSIQKDPQLPQRAALWLNRVLEIAERNRAKTPESPPVP